MRQELENVYLFVKKWAIEQQCDYEELSNSQLTFANDYTEYRLTVGHFNEPRLRAINVEMVIADIWDVPVPEGEERFLALMDVLNNPDWQVNK